MAMWLWVRGDILSQCPTQISQNIYLWLSKVKYYMDSIYWAPDMYALYDIMGV